MRQQIPTDNDLAELLEPSGDRSAGENEFDDDDEVTRMIDPSTSFSEHFAENARKGLAASVAPAASNWSLSTDGNVRENVSSNQILELWQSGQIHARTLVWKEGMPDWVPILDVPQLKVMIAAKGGSVPPPARPSSAPPPRRSAPPPARRSAPPPRSASEAPSLPPPPPSASKANGGGRALAPLPSFPDLPDIGDEQAAPPLPPPGSASPPFASARPPPARASARPPAVSPPASMPVAASLRAKASVPPPLGTKSSVPPPLAPSLGAKSSVRPPAAPSPGGKLPLPSAGSGLAGEGIGLPPLPPVLKRTASATTLPDFRVKGGKKKLGAALLLLLVAGLGYALVSGNASAIWSGIADVFEADTEAPMAASAPKRTESKAESEEPYEPSAPLEEPRFRQDEPISSSPEPVVAKPSKPARAVEPKSAAITRAAAPKPVARAAPAPAPKPVAKPRPAPKPEPKPAPVQSQPVAKSSGPEFDDTAARIALSGAAAKAAGCKKSGGPTGRGTASVTFGSSGKVSSVQIVGGSFPGAVGSCIQQAFRGVSVPAFSGGAVTRSKPFRIPD